MRSPLAECGITKQEVRELAAAWELPVADKPATPCLSSRVAYGQEVTPERLAKIDRAEQFLRSLGLRELRVRYHGDDLARIDAAYHLGSKPLAVEAIWLTEDGAEPIRIEIRDGVITGIDATSVTFRQEVSDPLSPVRTRDVRKSLYTSEEARQ